MAGHDETNWPNGLNPLPLKRGLGSLFGLRPDQLPPTETLAALFGAGSIPKLPAFDIPNRSGGYGLLAPEGPCRSRSSWNARFTHWERPESVSEQGTIERAKTNVSSAIANNVWLAQQGVRLEGQGSYFNRTNVRRDADIDLRIVHPLLKVLYDDNVHRPSANGVLNYSNGALTPEQVFSGLRSNLSRDLAARFGRANVEIGQKAIRIKGITGSRAEVDVVPAVRLHHVTWLPSEFRYQTIEGVAIFSTDGRWTFNFPEQHAANGRAKRARTGHQFKRAVRIFKRMQADLQKTGALRAKVPSFLIECLVYAVDDYYFQIPEDDRYSRIRRIVWQMRALLADHYAADRLTEISEMKWLFHSNQSWSRQDAQNFVNAAIVYLGDA